MTGPWLLALAYLFFAAAIALATWNNWWADAKLAGPALYAGDIAMFTLMVLLTEGYTTPFFTFFMFLLLSAAIRWGWRATALTAVLVTVLYLLAGLGRCRSPRRSISEMRRPSTAPRTGAAADVDDARAGRQPIDDAVERG